MTDQAPHRETFPFGILGAGLGEVRRQVPPDEPPPLLSDLLMAYLKQGERKSFDWPLATWP